MSPESYNNPLPQQTEPPQPNHTTLAPPQLLEIQKQLLKIEDKLNDIYKTVHPPLWKSIPKWIIHNIVPITLFVISVIGLYQGYKIFLDLKDQLLPLLEAKENLTSIDQKIINTIKDLKLPF